jgi:dynein heavy chain, axonemal
LDDIHTLLDDHIMKTQSMKASPYIQPIEERCKLWESKLHLVQVRPDSHFWKCTAIRIMTICLGLMEMPAILVQDTLEAWLHCQAGWVHLEPIFGSDDIMQQMPNEGRKFRCVDNTWRATMLKLTKNPEAVSVAADAELLRSLQEANALLDQASSTLCQFVSCMVKAIISVPSHVH